MARERIEDRVMIPRYIKGHIYEECGRICAHCGKPMEFFGDFTLEHVIPLSKGGTNDKKNLIALCETCNRQKSDDIIPPMEYFPYLPEEKRKKLQKMFDEYVKSQDWLAQDNLFMTDWFDINPTRCVFVHKLRQAAFLPVTLRVRRIRTEDAFNRLQDYKQYLRKEDAGLIVKSPDDIVTPYYVIEQNDKTLMFFTAYIWHNTGGLEDSEGWEYSLILDYYITPGLKMHPKTIPPTLYNILQALLHEAQKTLLNGANGTAIMVRFRSPASAPYAKELSQFVHESIPSFKTGQIEFGPPAPRNNKVNLMQCIMFQGGHKDLKQAMKESGAKTFEQFNQKMDRIAIQKDIKRRLDDSVAVHKKEE